MSRSLFKGPFLKNLKKKKNMYIQLKNVTILPNYINKTINIYSGKQNIPLKIQETMVGYRFGHFIRTRSIFKYKKK